MLRERGHRCPPPRPSSQPRGDPRPGPPSVPAVPGNAPRRPPPSIPSGQPPIPTSPRRHRSAGGAAAVPSAATAPVAGAAGVGSGARPLPGAGPAPAAASALLFLRRQDGGAARGRPSWLRRAPPSRPPPHWLGAHRRALIGRRRRRCCQGSGAGERRQRRPRCPWCPSASRPRIPRERGQRPAERLQRALPPLRPANTGHSDSPSGQRWAAGLDPSLEALHPGTHRLGPVPFASLSCAFLLRRPQQLDRALRNSPSVPAWKPFVPWCVTHAVSSDGRRAAGLQHSISRAPEAQQPHGAVCLSSLHILFCAPKISGKRD